MSKSRLVYSILAISFGIFMFVFGGADDSPGAQLIGALVFIGGIVSIIKGKKKKLNKS